MIIDLCIFWDSGGPLHDTDGIIVVPMILSGMFLTAKCKHMLTRGVLPSRTIHTKSQQGLRHS